MGSTNLVGLANKQIKKSNQNFPMGLPIPNWGPLGSAVKCEECVKRKKLELEIQGQMCPWLCLAEQMSCRRRHDSTAAVRRSSRGHKMMKWKGQ